jgi:hypothetical protein
MRKIQIPLVAAIIIGLLAGSTVAVVAQQEEVAPDAGVTVTGTWSFGGELAEGTQGSVDGVDTLEGIAEIQRWQTNDPRLSGDVTYTGHWSFFDSPDGWLTPQTATWELIGEDGGRWLGTSTGFDSAALGGIDTIVFTGEGAYAGLTAYIVSFSNELRGMIIPTDLHAPPEPYTGG